MSASFTVFVCSTLSDLSQEREGVLGAIRRLKLQHGSMEFFGARAEQPIETCLTEVRASDILVVIVGHTYGSIVPGRGISYSEAEYDEGRRLKKLCLVYMRDENVPILPKHMERDPEKLKLLEKWKKTLQTDHTIELFHDGDDLANRVTRDLTRTISGIATIKLPALISGKDALLAAIRRYLSDALTQGLAEDSLILELRKIESLLLLPPANPVVFLSYAPVDSIIVDQFIEELRRSGLMLITAEHFQRPVGDPSELQKTMRKLQKTLSMVDAIVFFISPSSVAEYQSASTLQFALSKTLAHKDAPKIIPILLEDADVPPLLRHFPWLDLRDGDIAKGVSRLVDAIRHSSDIT
jgi:hypothetical protein